MHYRAARIGHLEPLEALLPRTGGERQHETAIGMSGLAIIDQIWPVKHRVAVADGHAPARGRHAHQRDRDRLLILSVRDVTGGTEFIGVFDGKPRSRYFRHAVHSPLRRSATMAVWVAIPL
jgi:hypothetical protein